MKNQPFKTGKTLYHYTTVDCACRILASGKLKFGKLKRMNDINESFRPIFTPLDHSVQQQDVETELARYRQLSLSLNSPKRGFDIPAMWGHYADRGNGVCLVFNKAELEVRLQANKQILYKKVNYTNEYDNSIIGKEITNIPDFFREHAEQLFFQKTKDWAYEQEYRAVVRTESEKKNFFLKIDGCIDAVIMYSAEDIKAGDTVFKSQNYFLLKRIIASRIPLVLELGKFFKETTLRNQENTFFWSSQK